MTDVRLTALNPEDSKVYPVACNSSGELLTDKVDIGPNISIEGNLDVGGTITAVGGTSITNYNSEFASTVLSRWTSDFNTPNGTVCTFNADGSAAFGGDLSLNGATLTNTALGIFTDGSTTNGITVKNTTNVKHSFIRGFSSANAETFFIASDGSATFGGDVVIGSRGAKWLIRESNGVAMLIEQTERGAKDPRIEESPRIEEVRDLPRELDLVEAALSEIMGKLKMTPPAGWPVWDGDE